MPDYDIPERVSFERLMDILQGWYIAGADEEPVGTSDIEEASGISTGVGRQKSFFKDLGLTTGNIEGRKRELTEAGIEVTEALAVDDTETAKEEMRALLEDWDLTTKVQRIVVSNEPVSEEELFEKLCALVGRDPDGPSKLTTGIRTLINLFEWAEVIEKGQDGGFELVNHGESEDDTDTDGESDAEGGDNSPSSTDSDRDIQPDSEALDLSDSSGQTEIKINLDLTGDDDPEQVGELLRQVRLALESDFEALEAKEQSVDEPADMGHDDAESEAESMSRLDDFDS